MMIPQHIGIILDGNRRYAKQLMKRPWEGHNMGLEKAREVLGWACERGIRYLTAYTLSLENINSRPKRELNLILKYIGEEADDISNNRKNNVHKYGVKVRFIGRIHVLPDWLQKKIKKAEEKTAKYKNHVLNIAVAYGGQQEIVDATREILDKSLKGIIKPHELNEKMFKHHLYTNGQPTPDLIIRTGGEKRMSNFLLYQGAYSELFFTDKKWPEITKDDLNSILSEYKQRQRRFGK